MSGLGGQEIKGRAQIVYLVAAADKKFQNAMTKAKLPVFYLDSKKFAAKIAADIKYFEAYKAKKSK